MGDIWKCRICGKKYDDSEDAFMSHCMRGNACYNFVGTVEAIRNWIDKYQINPDFDENEKTKVVAIGEPVQNKHGEETETVVYPELYDGGHAVIDRLLSKAEAITKDSA